MLKGIGNFFKKLQKNAAVSRKTSGEFVLQKNNLGIISAELATVQRYVEKAAIEVDGITAARASVDMADEKSPLKIRFALELAQNFSVQDVSADLVKGVQKILQNIFSLPDAEIYIKVTDVSASAQKKRVRRVR